MKVGFVALAAVAVVLVVPTTGAHATAKGRTPCPTGAKHIRPGDHVQRVIDQAGVGGAVCFASGTYRLRTPLVPLKMQTFVSNGAVLSGARVLHFSKHGRVWTAPEFHADGQRNGQCLPESTTICTYPNDVLRDGVPMHRVLRAPTKRSQYEIKYLLNRVVLAAAPGKHRYEIEVSPAAFQSIGSDGPTRVKIRGFTIKNFASPAQHGAIDTAQFFWTISHSTIEENHGAGISTGGHAWLFYNVVRRNGEEGIAGVGVATVASDNVIAFNNFQRRFDPDWEAGGAKWAVASLLRVFHNNVHDNYGPGLWDDIDSGNVLYRRNRVVHNAYAGIFHEIGGSAKIDNNTVIGNGFGRPAWLWGSGILIAASHDVTVTRNLLKGNAEGIGEVQQDRGVSGRDGTPRVLANVDVRDNRVHLADGTTGLVEDNGDTALFSDPTLTWDDNQYWGLGHASFEWNDTELTVAQWKGVGHDVHGTFNP